LSDTEEKLTGGNMADVARIGDRVYRSTGFWSPTVHRLLQHLQNKNFLYSPKFFSMDREWEVLEFIPGVVPQYPFPDFVLSHDSISRAAKMLRGFHDATRDFVHLSSDRWQIPELWREPVEVVCHNDFSPYNTVFRDGLPVAMIDFDVAAPGPRVWDLAFAVYRFTHLCEISNGLIISETALRDEIKLFCSQYGLETDREVLEMIPVRLTVLCSTIERLASEDHAGVIKNVEDGHLDFYRREIQAIETFLRS
jgi:thiamine kinase-like enzyme